MAVSALKNLQRAPAGAGIIGADAHIGPYANLKDQYKNQTANFVCGLERKKRL